MYVRTQPRTHARTHTDAIPPGNFPPQAQLTTFHPPTDPQTFSAAESLGAIGRELTQPEMVGVAVAVLAAWALLNLLRVNHQGWLQVR